MTASIFHPVTLGLYCPTSVVQLEAMLSGGWRMATRTDIIASHFEIIRRANEPSPPVEAEPFAPPARPVSKRTPVVPSPATGSRSSEHRQHQHAARIERMRYIYEERRELRSLQAIADDLGITREWVRQIHLKAPGVLRQANRTRLGAELMAHSLAAMPEPSPVEQMAVAWWLTSCGGAEALAGHPLDGPRSKRRVS